MEISDVVFAIQKLRDDTYEMKLQLVRDYPAIAEKFDVRISGFTKLINALSCGQLASWFWHDCLHQAEWWRLHTGYIESDYPILLEQFGVFLKIGLVQTVFSAIESSLRALIRGIDPKAHKGGTSKFKYVYDDLIMKRLNKALPDGLELLDMFSKIRNTIHNNGFYYGESGKDTVQRYKGRDYAFKQGHAVDFITWSLVLEIFEDGVRLLDQIVRDPAIFTIAGTIPDSAD